MSAQKSENVPLLTVDDVAARLRLSPSKVRNLQRRIGYLKIGGCVRFEPAALERFLESCRRAAPVTRLHR